MTSVAAKVKATAPGQYLGYALQPVRLCFHLLSADQQSTASLEDLDDVAVTRSDNGILLEQTKSALKQNPVSDWSEDLWKTFANWLDNIGTGLVDPHTTRFQLYVTPLKSGYWVDRLSNTNFRGDVPGAVSDLRAAVTKLKPRPRCYRHLRKLLEADIDTVSSLVVNFRFVTDEDPIAPIRSILSIGIQEELLDMSCTHAIGLAKKSADDLIRRGLPAIVDSDEFRRNIRAFNAKNNLSKMLPSLGATPTEALIEKTFDDRPIFVQQLDAIEMPHYDVLRAISDFLHSASDKTQWAEKGLVVDESLLEFDQSLLRSHRLKKIEVDDIHCDLDPTKQGRVLYSRCVSIKKDLEGREVPSHFVPGCYNSLADRLELNWHPQFLTIVSGEGD